jgi:hypothetical protein
VSKSFARQNCDPRNNRRCFSTKALLYRNCAAIVIEVGKLVQVPVTTGLVQFRVFLPADPETENVPVHAPPFVAVEFHVNVPEKLLEVVYQRRCHSLPRLPKCPTRNCLLESGSSQEPR